MSRVRKNCSILSYLEASLTDFSQETPNFLASAPGLLPNFLSFELGREPAATRSFEKWWSVRYLMTIQLQRFEFFLGKLFATFHPRKLVVERLLLKIISHTWRGENYIVWQKQRKWITHENPMHHRHDDPTSNTHYRIFLKNSMYKTKE